MLRAWWAGAAADDESWPDNGPAPPPPPPDNRPSPFVAARENGAAEEVPWHKRLPGRGAVRGAKTRFRGWFYGGDCSPGGSNPSRRGFENGSRPRGLEGADAGRVNYWGRDIGDMSNGEPGIDWEEIMGRVMPHVLEGLAIIGACYYSYGLAHYGPQVQPQLAWTIVVVLFSLSTPNFIEPVAVGAITGMSTRKTPRIMPNVAWISFPMILSILVWYPFQKFKLFEGNGARYGLVAFISTNIALAVFMMPGNVIPWHRYGSDGAVTRWDSIVRFGLVARYLATTPLTAIVTRLTKISTGHHSITSAAAAALLLISLVQIIGGGVSKRYIYDVSSAITLGAFVGACEATVLQTTDVPLCAVLAVGVRLLMAPFCTGFAGKEAFSAFVAIVSFNKVRPGQQGVFED